MRWRGLGGGGPALSYDPHTNDPSSLSPFEVETARGRRIVAMKLQEIAANPLSADDVAMFEMFEREA